MKPQFSTATLLLGIACVAIASGSMIGGQRFIFAGIPEMPTLNTFLLAMIFTPWWMPFAFGAYILGRRRLTVRDTIAFVVISAAAVGMGVWANNLYTGLR